MGVEKSYTTVSLLSSGYFSEYFLVKMTDTGLNKTLKKVYFKRNIKKGKLFKYIKQEKFMIKKTKPGQKGLFFELTPKFENDVFYLFTEPADKSLFLFYKLAHRYSGLQGGMPERVISHLFGQIVSGLAFLYDQLEIVHRDVHPRNVLVTRSGHAKLINLNFSSAWATDKENGTSTSYSEKRPCRFLYKAPERFEKETRQIIDPRSDVWSLGISLYEVAIGKSFPSGKKEQNEIFKKLASETSSKSVFPLNNNLYSVNFQCFLDECLKYNYLDRPTCSQLLTTNFLTYFEHENIAKYIEDVLSSESAVQLSFTFEVDGRKIHVNEKNCKVICSIGEGSFGCVELVQHIETGFKMARKRKSQLEDTSLESELLFLETIESEEIVKFYGFLKDGQQIYLFMEFMELTLQTLGHRAEKTSLGHFPVDVLGKISYSLLKSLQSLLSISESMSAIHRDVKPDNILINLQGEVKLCDFNMARMDPHQSEEIIKSSLGEYTNIRYKAPERLLEETKNSYDFKSDIWSAGITILQAANKGKYPLSKEKDQARKQITEGDPELFKLDAELDYPEEFQHFLDKCLVRDPKDRYDYEQLLSMPFIERHKGVDLASYIHQLPDLDKYLAIKFQSRDSM